MYHLVMLHLKSQWRKSRKSRRGGPLGALIWHHRGLQAVINQLGWRSKRSRSLPPSSEHSNPPSCSSLASRFSEIVFHAQFRPMADHDGEDVARLMNEMGQKCFQACKLNLYEEEKQRSLYRTGSICLRGFQNDHYQAWEQTAAVACCVQTLFRPRWYGSY